ncbi:hypothetical protein TcWFU_006518 [Taenia crassiceps]|uniref:Uncharacterized protein n=1 Tax=Taenia crassiceps TaxID=6207 RepID=A0ABR4QRH0_9CEST
MLISLKAHRLLNPQATDLQDEGSTSWLVAESRFLRAKRLGVLAFVLNCCGILLTMCGIILLLMYFGTEPEQRTSILGVIASFTQCKTGFHPALARTSTPQA